MSRFQSFCPEAVTALIVIPVSSVVPAITEPQGEERIGPRQGCLFGSKKFMHKTQVQTSRASTILSSLHDVQVCIPLEMDCRTLREFSRKPSNVSGPRVLRHFRQTRENRGIIDACNPQKFLAVPAHGLGVPSRGSGCLRRALRHISADSPST